MYISNSKIQQATRVMWYYLKNGRVINILQSWVPIIKQSVNHYSKKGNSKFSSQWDTTMGVVAWRQGTTELYSWGSVGQKGSYPNIQSLIDIQET